MNLKTLKTKNNCCNWVKNDALRDVRHSTDPKLLAIAKDAMDDIHWPEPSEHVARLGAAIRGSGKLPKHVKQPKMFGPIFTGVFLQGKYRCLAFCPDVITAARLADIIVLQLDDYRKLRLATDEVVQRAMLNFTIEDAKQTWAECDSLQAWWSRILCHLTSESILIEAEEAATFIRTGRPKTVSNERIDAIERKLDDLLKRVEVLIDRPAPTTIFIGPNTPALPGEPAIGWPLPASPGDYPFGTPVCDAGTMTT